MLCYAVFRAAQYVELMHAPGQLHDAACCTCVGGGACKLHQGSGPAAGSQRAVDGLVIPGAPRGGWRSANSGGDAADARAGAGAQTRPTQHARASAARPSHRGWHGSSTRRSRPTERTACHTASGSAWVLIDRITGRPLRCGRARFTSHGSTDTHSSRGEGTTLAMALADCHADIVACGPGTELVLNSDLTRRYASAASSGCTRATRGGGSSRARRTQVRAALARREGELDGQLGARDHHRALEPC